MSRNDEFNGANGPAGYHLNAYDNDSKPLFLNPDIDGPNHEAHPTMASAFERVLKGGFGHRWDYDRGGFRRAKIAYFTVQPAGGQFANGGRTYLPGVDYRPQRGQA